MELSKTILACEEHIDKAIDDFINKFETFPNMDNYSEGKCDYCSQPVRYKLNSSTNNN